MSRNYCILRLEFDTIFSMEQKKCETCHKIFSKQSGRSYKSFEKAIFCSKACRRVTETTKKKMQTSHLGLKHRPMSVLGRLNIGKAHKGIKQTKETIEKRKLSNFGFKHSKETKEKISLLRKGEGNGMFGKKPWNRNENTPENKRLRRCREYGLWRTAVFKRDNFTCVWCGARSGNGKAIILNADHIKPFAFYPELRFAIDNGRTLCVSCHRTTDTYGRPKKKKI